MVTLVGVNRHTLELSPRVKQNKKSYLVLNLRGNRLAPQPDSDKGTESNKNSSFAVTIKRERQSVNKKGRQQLSEDEELPFQQGHPLKEDNINSKIRSHNHEIFMAFLSDATNRKSDSTPLEDLDYNEFLSE